MMPGFFLVLGDDELLVSRKVNEIIAQTPDAEVIRKDGASLDGSTVTDILNLGLFSQSQTAVVTDATSISKPALERIKALVPGLGADIRLVLAASLKATSLVKTFTPLGVEVIKLDKVTSYRDRQAFLRSEARAAGRRMTDGAARLMIESSGSDLRSLAAAFAQMASQFEVLDEANVGEFYRSSPVATGFQVADAAVSGDPRSALEMLRTAEASGTPLVLVASALISQMRDMTRVRALGTTNPSIVAARLGMPAWKAEKLTRKLSGWSDRALAEAFSAALATDQAVKGGSASPWAALERAVLTISQAKRR